MTWPVVSWNVEVKTFRGPGKCSLSFRALVQKAFRAAVQKAVLPAEVPVLD